MCDAFFRVCAGELRSWDEIMAIDRELCYSSSQGGGPVGEGLLTGHENKHVQCNKGSIKEKGENMQSMRKKLLSLLLALVMLFQLFPVTALAEDGEDAGEMPQPEGTILASEGWEEPVPVGEDESKREENIKQFRMTDGSWLAAYLWVKQVPIKTRRKPAAGSGYAC